MEYKNHGKEYFEFMYNDGVEEKRLTKNWNGKLEFFTTMTYIKKYLKPNSKILEIGAGTGRYSIALAKEGYEVTAVELLDVNVEILKENASNIKNIKVYQGDALNLSMLKDNTYDMVLVLGPMYHLYNNEHHNRAIDEAIRLAKKDAILMFAYLSVHGVLLSNYSTGDFLAGIEENFDKKFNIKHFPAQYFTTFTIKDFENLFKNKRTKKLKSISTDNILEILIDVKDFTLTEQDFEVFKNYHLKFCENKEMQGYSNHLLYICKKV